MEENIKFEDDEIRCQTWFLSPSLFDTLTHEWYWLCFLLTSLNHCMLNSAIL